MWWTTRLATAALILWKTGPMCSFTAQPALVSGEFCNFDTSWCILTLRFGMPLCQRALIADSGHSSTLQFSREFGIQETMTVSEGKCFCRNVVLKRVCDDCIIWRNRLPCNLRPSLDGWRAYIESCYTSSVTDTALLAGYPVNV
jgi:hypothetical protein